MYLYLFYWRLRRHNCLIRSHTAHSSTYLSVDTEKYHMSSLAQAKPLFNFSMSKSVIRSWKWLADTRYVAEFETYVQIGRARHKIWAHRKRVCAVIGGALPHSRRIILKLCNMGIAIWYYLDAQATACYCGPLYEREPDLSTLYNHPDRYDFRNHWRCICPLQHLQQRGPGPD